MSKIPDEFTNAMIKGLVSVLVAPTVDQWGNQQESPLKRIIYQWFSDNSKTIEKEIYKRIDKNKEYMDRISKEVTTTIDSFSMTDRYFSSRDSEYMKTLKDKVTEIVAHKLAEQQLAKIKQEETQ